MLTHLKKLFWFRVNVPIYQDHCDGDSTKLAGVNVMPHNLSCSLDFLGTQCQMKGCRES